MTTIFRYNGGMELLSVQTQGMLFCALLLALLFLLVHLWKLLHIVRTLKTRPPEKKPEPVYFLVERKKKRSKKEFSEPKEISFR